MTVNPTTIPQDDADWRRVPDDGLERDPAVTFGGRGELFADILDHDGASYGRPFTDDDGAAMVTVYESDGDRYVTYGVPAGLAAAWEAYDAAHPTPCVECGDDDAAPGQTLCTDCLPTVHPDPNGDPR